MFQHITLGIMRYMLSEKQTVGYVPDNSRN